MNVYNHLKIGSSGILSLEKGAMSVGALTTCRQFTSYNKRNTILECGWQVTGQDRQNKRKHGTGIFSLVFACVRRSYS